MGAGFGMGQARGCSGAQWIINRLICVVMARLAYLFRCLFRFDGAFNIGGEGVGERQRERLYVTGSVLGKIFTMRF
jgi:hypothetical protein